MKILAIWITKGLFIFVVCIAEWNVCSNLENLKGLIKSKTLSGVLDCNGAILFNDGEKYLTLENTILLSGFLSPNPNNYRLIIGADRGGCLFATCTPLTSYSVIKDETITVTLFYMEKQ